MFNALWAKVATGVSVVLLLAMLGLYLFKQGEISHLQTQLESANKTVANQTADLATLRGNQKGLETGIAACNSSVDAYSSVVEKLAATGKAALAEVQKGNATLTSKLKTIDAMPAASCADAVGILKAGAK